MMAAGPSLTARFLRRENGATAIEYALIGCFIVIVIVSSVSSLGDGVKTLYNKIELAFE